MAYVDERLAQIRSDSLLRAKEIETVRALRELKKPPTKDDLEYQSMGRAPVGYVYFIKSGALVKIGFSGDVISRLSSIRVGCPADARLVAAIPGTEDTETYFHKMFADLRDRGEWFRVEGLLKEFMRSMPTSITLPERRAKREASDGIRL